jgi:hypothetical protein
VSKLGVHSAFKLRELSVDFRELAVDSAFKLRKPEVDVAFLSVYLALKVEEFAVQLSFKLEDFRTMGFGLGRSTRLAAAGCLEVGEVGEVKEGVGSSSYVEMRPERLLVMMERVCHLTS